MKITSLILRLFLFSACVYVATSCNEQIPQATTAKAPTHVETVAPVQAIEEAAPSAEAEAHFEAGLQAANVNDMSLAHKEFLAAAKEAHVYAQYNVALMYEQGLGTDKNEKEAVHWYTKSAMQGNSASQFNLGVCYENGIGTAVDFKKANDWYRKASLQGDGLAVGNLGMLYMRGDGVEENKVAAMALLLLSATLDSSPENQARNGISKTRGLTQAMVTKAQALSEEMSASNDMLVTLDNYLSISE